VRHNQPTNQPTTNDQRRHDTAYLNKRLFYKRKVRRLKILNFMHNYGIHYTSWVATKPPTLVSNQKFSQQ